MHILVFLILIGVVGYFVSRDMSIRPKREPSVHAERYLRKMQERLEDISDQNEEAIQYTCRMIADWVEGGQINRKDDLVNLLRNPRTPVEINKSFQAWNEEDDWGDSPVKLVVQDRHGRKFD